MSDEKWHARTGGAAFPHTPKRWHSDAGCYVIDDECDGYGMTLRDWFAGRETLSDCNNADGTFWSAILGRQLPLYREDPLGYIKAETEARAILKWMRADAMLAARKEGGAA